jgi:hypothetical protein
LNQPLETLQNTLGHHKAKKQLNETSENQNLQVKINGLKTQHPTHSHSYVFTCTGKKHVLFRIENGTLK